MERTFVILGPTPELVVVSVDMSEIEQVLDDINDLIETVARKRDKDAFQRLFGEVAPRLKGFFMRAGCPASDAEDLVQDVMFKVWSRAEQFDRTKASGPTWIFTIARNRMVDRFRRQSRPEPDPKDPLFNPILTPLELRVDKVLKGRTVRAALDELPVEQADVVRRSYFQGHSLSEIAEATNAPLGTIKTRARLAMKFLRERMAGGEL
ncbi:MAG: sigma-70 family RNA polymerase sigma factor [Myxococcota bacterium]